MAFGISADVVERNNVPPSLVQNLPDVAEPGAAGENAAFFVSKSSDSMSSGPGARSIKRDEWHRVCERFVNRAAKPVPWPVPRSPRMGRPTGLLRRLCQFCAAVFSGTGRKTDQ